MAKQLPRKDIAIDYVSITIEGSSGLGLSLNQRTREAFRVPVVFSVPDELL